MVQTKKDKMLKEFNEKSNMILNKTLKAFEKLEKEYGFRICTFTAIRQDDYDSWNSIIVSNK